MRSACPGRHYGHHAALRSLEEPAASGGKTAAGNSPEFPGLYVYIKSYSGRLSAMCGYALAGGTGAACGMCYLRGGSAETIGRVISNMATGVTGMICDGGNQGCVMKGIAACDAAFSSVELAMDGVCVEALHGINGRTPEETMRNIGKVASPGMTETEKAIVEIQAQKAI